MVKRYAIQKRLPELKTLRIIVIYTADVETSPTEYNLGGILVRIEPAFLVNLDNWRKSSAGKSLWTWRNRCS